MKVVTFISLLLVLGFIQESFQYGTIFTDNITPAFQLSTYFQGIKTEKAFSTDSDIGVIGASNLLGFTVSTPGPLTTNSDTFSVTGSHEVNFGGSQTDVTVHTDGDFTTTSQRTSISGGAVNFAGTGNVFVGGLDSTLQAGEFTFTAAEDISLRATGDVLRVVAPVSIEFSMSRDGILNAERNIQIVSDTSDISFTAFNNFDVTSNHIDIDGSDLLSIVVDNDIALAAGSIIEFLPVGAFEAQVDDLDVTVSSGDIQLIASSRIHFHGNESRSSFKIVAQDDVFFTLKSTSEATMAVICGDDVTIRATEQITFASFLDQSDLSLAAFDKINHTAPIIELTTINGTSIAGGKLSTSARDYVLFEVLNEDLTATAINGPISFTAGGNFSVATNNDFVAEAVNIYQKTNNDIQIFARNILVKQDNIDTNGVITVNVDTDIDVSTGALLFATAGDHIWTIQGDSTVTADNDITFRAAKGYENDLVFSVNGNTTISATDIDYTSAVITISATDYIARTQDDYRIFSQNDIRFNTQGQFIAVADDVSFDSQYGDLTFRITGDSALTTTNGDFSHNAFKFEFEADSIVYNADDAQVEIQSQLTAEISGNAYWQTTTFELVASATVQILADTFNFQSNDDAIFTVGQAVQLSQNYPGDYFQITTGEFNIFADSSIDILSGRNLNFIATNVNIDESVSSHYAAQETLDIRTDTLNINTQSSASFISGGKLLFSSGNTIDLSSEDEFFITGSTGQFGLTSFRANDIIVSTRNDPVSGFITMSAEDITFDATNSFYEENFDALEITVPFPRVQDEARSKFYGNTLQIVAPQSISASSDFVNFYANALNQEATDFTLTASNILKITTPLFQTTFDDMTLQAPAITWNGEDLKLISDQPGRFNADSDLNGVGDFEGYSGVDFLYKVDNAFTISAPIINVDSEDLLSIISLTDISFGFDNTISFLSGGKTTWDIAGDISYTANDLATIQSFYTSISTTADIQFTAQQSNILLQAADGFAKFQGNDYMTLFSGQQSLFQAGNNIITNSQVFYSANSYNGLTSTLTNDVGFSATARAPDGNVVFDALAGGIQGIFQENEHYRTNAYTNVVGATGVSWTAVRDITTTVFKDFNVSSIANTKFTTVGDFTHKVAKYANYQSRNAYVLDADQDFLLSAATDLLVSTGEQGQLDFTSLANLDVVTTSFQHWRSSDSFAVTSANNGIVFNSHVTDILVNTFGGQISLESPTGGHYLDVAGQNMQMFSGDFTKITSSSDQSWSAATQLRGLAKGDVFFDGLNTGSFQFTSENQNRWNADGTRFDEDGISFTTPVLTQFGASTASFNPALTLQFGGKTRPVLDFATGGSSTQAGYILQSQGNIYIASETANFDAASNYYVNTFKDTSYSSDAELSLEATTGAVTLLSDAGNLKFFAETLTSTAATAYSLTATSGVFEILSSSRNPLAKTYFEADSTITTTSSTWAFVSGSTKQSANSARYATTTSAKFLSVDGSDGSLSFYGNTLNQLSSRGAITIHTLGQDGNLLVQAGTLDVTTKVSSDITFKAASLYKQGSASTTTYSAGTSLNFIAESVINQDYTKGDIRFFAGGDISIKSADTMSFSAFADISIQADAQISVTSTGDIALNSFDDTILSVTSAFTSSSTGLLTFENTPGSGGDWNVISSQPSDSTTYQTGHDVTFDMGGNIIGHTAENLFYKSLDSNGQDIAQVYTTTAPGGNIKLSSSANTQLRAFSNVQIDSNGPLSVLGYLNTQFSANGVANQQSFTFNSTQGSIMYASLLGSVTSQAQGQFRLTATGNLELTANGISRDSSSGISVSAPQGSTTFGAGDSITVSAHEAITFGLDHLGARFLIGASRFIDFGAAGNGVARTSTTLFKATGHEADIVLNLRESRDGIGYLRFLAGSVDPLEDYKSANGVVDIFATESIRFEQNSGFTWAGVYPATFTQVTGSTSLSPSDIFFNADGEHSSIEVGTTKEALLANINVLTQALILEADGKMTIATFGEAGSSVEFISKQEAIKVQSFSQSENDGVFLTSYNGDITMVAAGFGEIHLEPERNLLLTSHRGFDISTDSINMIEPSSTFLVRVTDGDINLNYGTLTVVTLNDIEITTFQPTNPTGQNIYFEAPDLIFEAFDDVSISASNLGNIYFRFYSLADFSGVDEVIFTHPSSVAIPMRESDLAPGQQCSIPGELVIFRDMDFFNAYSPYTTQLDSDNDSGVQICFCMRSRIWACRILSNAQPFSQPP